MHICTHAHRWSTVRIEESPAVLLRGMAGSSLGIWVAHGEGQALFPEAALLERVTNRKLVPLRSVCLYARVCMCLYGNNIMFCM